MWPKVDKKNDADFYYLCNRSRNVSNCRERASAHDCAGFLMVVDDEFRVDRFFIADQLHRVHPTA